MANRVVGRSGGKNITALMASAGLAALAGSGLIGCSEEDPSATALSDASVQLRAISPGSVPPTNDSFATDGYRATSAKLAPATRDGTDAQRAIASILTAEIEMGQARPAMTKLAELEHEIGSKLTRIMSLETARASAQQTAEVLGGYDPSAERAAIDQRTSALQQDLSDAQGQQQELRQRVEDLGTQITSLEGQVSTIRGEESALRDRALTEDPIAAAQTVSQARDTGRRADGLEVQASTLDAQRSVLRPQIEAVGVRIDAINAQLGILSEARESVAQQARRSSADASAAQALAREYSAEMVTRAAEVGALHQNEAQAAVAEAQQALEKASSAARGARSLAADGSLAAAGASRSLGDLLARRAGSLMLTADTFRGLGGRMEGEQGRRLSTLASQLSQQADSLKQDAIRAYQQAASGFDRVRAPGATGDAFKQAVSDLNRAIERLGGRVEGSDDPMDQGMGEESPDDGVMETTGEIGG